MARQVPRRGLEGEAWPAKGEKTATQSRGLRTRTGFCRSLESSLIGPQESFQQLGQQGGHRVQEALHCRQDPCGEKVLLGQWPSSPAARGHSRERRRTSKSDDLNQGDVCGALVQVWILCHLQAMSVVTTTAFGTHRHKTCRPSGDDSQSLQAVPCRSVGPTAGRHSTATEEVEREAEQSLAPFGHLCRPREEGSQRLPPPCHHVPHELEQDAGAGEDFQGKAPRYMSSCMFSTCVVGHENTFHRISVP